MSKLDLAFPNSTKSIIDQPTCSLTTPNSLVTGCLDGIKDASKNPGAIGAAGIGVGLTAGTAALKNNSVIGAVGEALGAETLGACAYGVINTAVDNCKATDPSNFIQITPTITPTTDDTPSLLGNIGELN